MSWQPHNKHDAAFLAEQQENSGTKSGVGLVMADRAYVERVLARLNMKDEAATLRRLNGRGRYENMPTGISTRISDDD
jgi:hypothetical protein